MKKLCRLTFLYPFLWLREQAMWHTQKINLYDYAPKKKPSSVFCFREWTDSGSSNDWSRIKFAPLIIVGKMLFFPIFSLSALAHKKSHRPLVKTIHVLTKTQTFPCVNRVVGKLWCFGILCIDRVKVDWLTWAVQDVSKFEITQS